MKMIVKLTVLITTLLLFAGLSFADDCGCYDVTYTGFDAPVGSSFFLKICFDYGDNDGEIYGLCDTVCGPPDPLYMFFDSFRQQAYAYKGSQGVCMVHLKFHGDNQYVVDGNMLLIFGRGTLRGHKTDLAKCSCP
jgi:hypothetical protein